MRNLFDQYEAPENRLTHALAVSLAEDRRLLLDFVRRFSGAKSPRAGRLEIVEQTLPGEVEPSEESSDERGLPDAWIEDGMDWALLIESKVAAGASVDQLRRHLATARQRDRSRAEALLISAVPFRGSLPERCDALEWSKLYNWARAWAPRSEWAARLARYLEVAEVRLAEKGYLREGTLTEFSGVPFGAMEAYSYGNAKRVLDLALAELRKRKELGRTALADLTAPGRPAITGSAGVSVWNVIPVLGAPRGEGFVRHPHFTLSIGSTQLAAQLTLPNDMRTSLRRNLVELGVEGLRDVVGEVTRRLLRALRRDAGAIPSANLSQRHFRARRLATYDARVEFDLRTAFPSAVRGGSSVKLQREWLDASLSAFVNKHSNLQLAFGATFPYASSRLVGKREVLDLIASTWTACRPLVDAALDPRRA